MHVKNEHMYARNPYMSLSKKKKKKKALEILVIPLIQWRQTHRTEAFSPLPIFHSVSPKLEDIRSSYHVFPGRGSIFSPLSISFSDIPWPGNLLLRSPANKDLTSHGNNVTWSKIWGCGAVTQFFLYLYHFTFVVWLGLCPGDGVEGEGGRESHLLFLR